jgi:hypothetical protein
MMGRVVASNEKIQVGNAFSPHISSSASMVGGAMSVRSGAFGMTRPPLFGGNVPAAPAAAAAAAPAAEGASVTESAVEVASPAGQEGAAGAAGAPEAPKTKLWGARHSQPRPAVLQMRAAQKASGEGTTSTEPTATNVASMDVGATTSFDFAAATSLGAGHPAPPESEAGHTTQYRTTERSAFPSDFFSLDEVERSLHAAAREVQVPKRVAFVMRDHKTRKADAEAFWKTEVPGARPM